MSIPTASVVPEAASILRAKPLQASLCGSDCSAEYARYMQYTEVTADGKSVPARTSGEMETSVKPTKSTIDMVITATLKEHGPAFGGLNQTNRMPAAQRDVGGLFEPGAGTACCAPQVRTDERKACQVAASCYSKHGLVVALVLLRCCDPGLVDAEDEVQKQEHLNQQEEHGANPRYIAVREHHAVGKEEGQGVASDPQAQLDGRASRHQELGSIVVLVLHAHHHQGQGTKQQLHN
jgi:hypothetical protein